ncbi:uncharacterized protein A4U43_C05F34480 [Asparagus officinalis]|uniref:USP domain-containing protein n=1 Tax=Asparagus officinalis TaxID=4686 RepID=A0A5P1EYH6_ASPOF|nr:uncharacterized protein A4U43_C05F34480 [Asparagus officinalis]
MLALDLSSLLPLVLTAIALVLGSLFVVKKAASKYFVVDASFGTGPAMMLFVWRVGERGPRSARGARAFGTDKVDSGPSGGDGYRRRKSSITLVPARGTYKILHEPKKILFPYDEFIKLFNWDKPGFPPCGLLNCGNSCFANVVLQCLACTRPLVAYLLEKDHRRECIKKQEDWCFLCELQAHIQRASQSRQPFSPINILSRIPNIGGNLGYGSQEDAHELMRFAIDTMQSVCLEEHGGEKGLDPSTQETTLIQHIFGGHLQSQVKCTICNMISNRYENMMDLTVEIHGDAESLEECLEQFTVKEWLDGDNKYKCDGCNGYVKAWKRLTVHQAPNILTIALKRFQSGRFGKLNKRVTFPEELDLSPYMSEDGDGTDKYSLYAVVVHVDMLNASFFGHYICYTKDYYGCWYRIDDCKVTVVDVEEVLSQGAYMLLYSRRTARREPFVKPIESARKKHLALREIDLSNVPNGHDVSSDTTSFPSSTGSESNSDLQSLSSNTSSESSISLLRDTGHDRLADIKTDSMIGKEDLELQLPVEVTLMLAQKDSGDMVMNDSASGPEVYEEGSLSQPSHIQEDSTSPAVEHRYMESDKPKSSEGDSWSQRSHIHGDVDVPQNNTNFCSPAAQSSDDVQDMECDEPPGVSNSNSHAEDNGSVCSTGEVPHLSGHAPEPNMVKHCPSGITDGVEKLANISTENGAKASTVVLVNGSRGKPKPLFSRGFLDKPTGEKSVTHIKRTQTGKSKVPPSNIANGYANGKSELTNGTYAATVSAKVALKSEATCSNDTSVVANTVRSKENGSNVSKEEAASSSGNKNTVNHQE